jgi:hypothetical protein
MENEFSLPSSYFPPFCLYPEPVHSTILFVGNLCKDFRYTYASKNFVRISHFSLATRCPIPLGSSVYEFIHSRLVEDWKLRKFQCIIFLYMSHFPWHKYSVVRPHSSATVFLKFPVLTLLYCTWDVAPFNPLKCTVLAFNIIFTFIREGQLRHKTSTIRHV